MIGMAERIQGLYVIRSTSFNSICSTITNKVSAATWHNRLGHPSIQRLDVLKSSLLCDVSKLNTSPCYICPLAKQRRLPFVSHNRLFSSAFELIHCDIWGPYHELSHSSHCYFLTIVDDCTRFTWVYMLKHKSYVSIAIPRFFAMVAT